MNKFNRLSYRIFFLKKKKNIHFTWNEKTLLLIFFFPSFFFFFSPQLPRVIVRIYLECRGGEGQIGIFEWSSTVLHNDSPLCYSISKILFPSILLDSIDSFRPRTILSPVVPGSFLVP